MQPSPHPFSHGGLSSSISLLGICILLQSPTAAPQVFAGHTPELSFPEILERFGQEARLDGTYFLCKQDDMLALAKALEQVR